MTAPVTKTRSQLVAADISALLRARNPLVWVVTREEARVERYLAEAAAAAGFKPVFWDVAAGVTGIDGKVANVGGNSDTGATLTAIRERADKPADRNVEDNFRTAWIMRDLPKWLDGPLGFTQLRQIRNLCRYLPGVKRDNAQAMIILTTERKVPADLEGHAIVIDWPLPDRAEITAVLDAAIKSLPADIQEEAAPGEVRDLAIDAAIGLSGEEAASCFAKSLVQTKRIDVKTVSDEKKRVIAKAGVLEWIDPLKDGLDSVGGLENLKGWIRARRRAYSEKAREYGLPAPKGAMLVGIPGCGKSLTAKAFPTDWGVPLVRLDLGALKGKFVGESEANVRKALSVIEAIGRCTVWIDEIEKGLAGATGGASADGGVSQDQLGMILTWLQERASEAFVIATANDIEGLPPELLRKGRFDEVWYVGFPNRTEIKQVLGAALRANKRGHLVEAQNTDDKAFIDLDQIAAKIDGKKFTGSEIAELVPTALYAAFAEDAREITTADLLNAAADVVPLSKTHATKIDRLEKFAADGRARLATALPTGIVGDRSNAVGGRQLDV